MDLKSEKAKDLTKREVFILIREFLDEQIDLSRRKVLQEDNFTLPSWSEFQAYQLGVQKAFIKLKDQLPDQGE
jgi:hypothetical protein